MARDFTEEEMQGYQDAYGPDYGFLAHSNYSLGGDGIRVRRDLDGWNDRALEAITVSLVIPSTDVGAGTKTLKLKVPGEASEDESGYMKQIRGERYEFVSADQVTLYGKGTMLIFYVHPDGTIGRIVNPQFKAPTLLCNGPSPDLNLNIPYNGDVRKSVTHWTEQLDSARPGDGLTYFRACDVVYNYSENGNVLDSVASMKNKVSFTTVDGKAVTAAIWR